MAEDYSFPERFVARRWADPLAEKFGFPVNSIYTEATRSKWIFETLEFSAGSAFGSSDGG